MTDSEFVHIDRYFRFYTKMWRYGWNQSNMPLWKKGNYTVKAPLHMSNLADAIMASIDNPAAKGVTFEACGYDNRHEKTV